MVFEARKASGWLVDVRAWHYSGARTEALSVAVKSNGTSLFCDDLQQLAANRVKSVLLCAKWAICTIFITLENVDFLRSRRLRSVLRDQEVADQFRKTGWAGHYISRPCCSNCCSGGVS